MEHDDEERCSHLGWCYLQRQHCLFDTSRVDLPISLECHKLRAPDAAVTSQQVRSRSAMAAQRPAAWTCWVKCLT